MFLKVQDLLVYQRLCDLHLEICNLTRGWPAEETFELGSQVRRSSNSSPAFLAERHGDSYERKLPGDERRWRDRKPEPLKPEA